MKSIKDIEQITIEELEAASFDEKIVVPHDLGHKIQSRILSKKKKVYSMIGVAAAVTVIVTGLSAIIHAVRVATRSFLVRFLATVRTGVSKKN